DYVLPDFKVSYFIDDAESVTAGNVKTAIELKVTYN
ncbi:fimbrial protein, partial [Salmonella enterica]|nr:fimbrial protein [Salmonella enterica]